MVAMKDGDWYCLKCRDLQFKTNTKCRHCGAPRTYSEEEESAELALDAESWLGDFDIDEDKKWQFLKLSPEQQQIIINKGPLQGCREPTAVLVSRLNALPPDPELAAGPEGNESGQVKSYSVFKGFGFIYPRSEGEPDIFLHFRSIVDGSIPSAGDILTYDLEEADTDVEGQLKAVNVRGGTGYPVTPEQKGKGKGGKDSGKAAGKSSGKGSFGPSTARMSAADGDWGGPYSKGSGRGTAKGRKRGQVKSYSVFKGFGFIFPAAEDEPDIFLHVKSIVDESIPTAGDILTFDLEPANTDVQGQMKAVNVRGGTGYPLTDQQKAEKGKAPDKDSPKGSGKASAGDKKSAGGKTRLDEYESGGCKGYASGKSKGYPEAMEDDFAWGAAKGYAAAKAEKASKAAKAGMKGWDAKGWDAKGWGFDPSWDPYMSWAKACGKGWDGGKGWAVPPWDPYMSWAKACGKGWTGW